MVAIENNRCPANHQCPAVRVCPVDALIQKGYNVPTVDSEKCVDCGKCVNVCPTGAIRIEGR